MDLPQNIINIVVFFPLVAAFILLLIPEDAKTTIRRLALLFSLVPLLLVVAMWLDYDANFRGLTGYAFEYQVVVVFRRDR